MPAQSHLGLQRSSVRTDRKRCVDLAASPTFPGAAGQCQRREWMLCSSSFLQTLRHTPALQGQQQLQSSSMQRGVMKQSQGLRRKQ